MFIILNPNSGGGHALNKWATIKNKAMTLENVNFKITKCSEEAEIAIEEQIKKGERNFVAAGGDGTINTILQALVLHQRQYPDLALGAIGLGSSNDFHKPFAAGKQKNATPIRIDFSHLVRRDVGVVRFTDTLGSKKEKYWLLNASIGVTAEANAFFNLESRSRMMRFTKKLNSKAAILYAALRTILFYHNLELTLGVSSSRRIMHVTNLGIVKSPHFAGDFTYDCPLEIRNGHFYVKLAHDLRLRQILNLLHQLSKGKFSGLRNTESSLSDELRIESNSAFALEFDGEVVRTQRATFSILKETILIAS